MGLIVDIKKTLGQFQLDVSFQCETGITGVLGASGCGKSVTLRCIAGIEHPDDGHIELDGQILFDAQKGINLPPQRRQVGYLFQNYALFPNMTVEKNIMSGIQNRKRKKEETDQLIRSFRLEECRGKYPGQLSGGQQQRIALARILASRPKALLLDEPFSAMDSFLKWQIEMELMEHLNDFSGPVLFVTHDRDEICHQCRNVCVLDHGTSQPMQTVDELFDSPTTVSACRLSGCENVSGIRMLEDGSAEAEDWGANLHLRRPVTAAVTHIGIRARFVRCASGPGPCSIRCRLLRRVNVGGTARLLLLPVTGDSPLRMEMDKEANIPLDQFGFVWIEFPEEYIYFLENG